MIYFTCCLLFVSFAFTYLFAFQSDVLTMAQHILSKGRTSYQVLLFSVLITLFLSVLPFVKARYVCLPTRAISLCWIPSFMLLGWLTDVALSEAVSTSQCVGPLPFIIFGLVYLLLTVLLSQMSDPKEASVPLTNLLWPNLMGMVVGITFAMFVGNTNQTMHFELRLERMVSEGRYEEAIKMCSKIQIPSRNVSSVRAYALSRLGKMGDELFMYPNKLGGASLLPMPSDSLRPANMPRELKEHLGGYPIHDMDATRYLQYLAADTLATPNAKEYLLCALLLDKNLDAFVDSLVVYYGPKDSVDASKEKAIPAKTRTASKKSTKKEPVHFTSLPRHYAEALLLYMRRSDDPVAVLDDDEILENYMGFQKLYKKSPDLQERERMCREYYNETYWSFYFFTK